MTRGTWINPLNAELNPICHLLALLRAYHIFHVSGLRVNIKFQIQSEMSNCFLQCVPILPEHSVYIHLYNTTCLCVT
jgi:hypothetical protein